MQNCTVFSLFLYTKGTEDLQQLARYRENSTVENVKSEGLAGLHEMVRGVKSDREVGLAYMKAYEAEKRIRVKERAEGKAEGKAEDILELLEEFGSIPDKLEKQIREQKDLETLRIWLKLAARAKTIEAFEGLAGISGHREMFSDNP